MQIWQKNLIICWFGVFITSVGISQIVPVLPLYFDYLGVHNVAEIKQWSVLAFGISTFTMAIFHLGKSC